VDQTPQEMRRSEIYEQFKESNVRVIFLDRAGQSNARNVGIKATSGDWCLLFEDDAVAWDDMVKQHVRAVEYTGAAASTGISLAPWKTREHIPREIRHLHLSDVLATGNSLVRRDALMDVGGLDCAFDRGSGADHDLGVRLYLSGHEIVFNPLAIETHYKAATGGMRTFGAWWRNQATFWGAYPPPTQIYTIRKYYQRKFWKSLYLLLFIHAAGRLKGLELGWLWMTGVWKFKKSLSAARNLHPSTGWAANEEATK
jgi:GT2 family glycosyltransferase